MSYPKIGRASIEVKVEGLTWSTNGYRADVLGIILLVLGWDITGLGIWGRPLLKDSLDMSSPTEKPSYTVLTLLLDLPTEEVWTRFGGRELVLVEQVDVRLGS